MSQISSIGGQPNLAPQHATEAGPAPDLNQPVQEAPQAPAGPVGPPPTPLPQSRAAEQQMDAAAARANVQAKRTPLPGQEDLEKGQALVRKREVYDKDDSIKQRLPEKGKTYPETKDVATQDRFSTVQTYASGDKYHVTADKQYRVVRHFNDMSSTNCNQAIAITNLPPGRDGKVHGKIEIRVSNPRDCDDNGMPRGSSAEITVVRDDGTASRFRVDMPDPNNPQPVYDMVNRIKQNETPSVPAR